MRLLPEGEYTVERFLLARTSRTSSLSAADELSQRKKLPYALQLSCELVNIFAPQFHGHLVVNIKLSFLVFISPLAIFQNDAFITSCKERKK